jgi:hypothetical protein
VLLEDFIGEHRLSGVEYGMLPPNEDAYRYEAANTMAFVLDGKAYCAIEDPSDGYRSCMRDLIEVPVSEIKNKFRAVKVVGRMREGRNSYGHATDILELIIVKTGALVLEVGTDSTDDYYPSFVAWFDPKVLPQNKRNE